MPDRSFHFIPGHRPELFDCVDRFGADHYIFDLEDSVPQHAKEQARAAIWQFTASCTRHNWFVRIHASDSPEFGQDLTLLRALPAMGVVVPKIANEQVLHELVAGCGVSERRIIGLIESFAGVDRLPTIVARAPVALLGLGLGVEDMLASSCFQESAFVTLVAHVKCQLAVTCLARDMVPIDGICSEMNDDDTIAGHCLAGRSVGMLGKFTIHPRQIPIVNRLFSPDGATQSWAEEILRHAGPEAHTGYRRVGDTLITPPKVRKAHCILNLLRDINHG